LSSRKRDKLIGLAREEPPRNNGLSNRAVLACSLQ
jgi:hypothetical protein